MYLSDEWIWHSDISPYIARNLFFFIFILWLRFFRFSFSFLWTYDISLFRCQCPTSYFTFGIHIYSYHCQFKFCLQLSCFSPSLYFLCSQNKFFFGMHTVNENEKKIRNFVSKQRTFHLFSNIFDNTWICLNAVVSAQNKKNIAFFESCFHFNRSSQIDKIICLSEIVKASDVYVSIYNQLKNPLQSKYDEIFQFFLSSLIFVRFSFFPCHQFKRNMRWLYTIFFGDGRHHSVL